MVKVKSWLFTEVRGKVKKAEFRRRKNKVTELSQKRIPFNPRTPAQRIVRRTYGECVEEWNKLSEAEKREWRILGTLQGISGYNAFMRDCITKKLGVVWYEILIDNTGNPDALSDFQVLLEVTNDEAFFKNADWKQEALEFYDTDKATLLNHYTELWDTLHYNAKIWIKVPYIPANECRFIYLKMNTKRTTDLSNPENVFDFYDDFEGDALDTNKWNETRTGGGITLSNSIITLKDGARIDGKTSLGLSVLAEFKAKFSAWDSSFGQVNVGFRGEFEDKSTTDANAVYIFAYNRDTYFRLMSRKDGTGSAIDTNKEADNAEHIFKVIRVSESKVKAQIDDLSPVEKTDNIPTTDIPVTLETRPSYSETLEVNWVRVRKYTEPEPTVSYAKA